MAHGSAGGRGHRGVDGLCSCALGLSSEHLPGEGVGVGGIRQGRLAAAARAAPRQPTGAKTRAALDAPLPPSTHRPPACTHAHTRMHRLRPGRPRRCRRHLQARRHQVHPLQAPARGHRGGGPDGGACAQEDQEGAGGKVWGARAGWGVTDLSMHPCMPVRACVRGWVRCRLLIGWVHIAFIARGRGGAPRTPSRPSHLHATVAPRHLCCCDPRPRPYPHHPPPTHHPPTPHPPSPPPIHHHHHHPKP